MRRTHDDRVSELTRRRLELLVAELDRARGADPEARPEPFPGPGLRVEPAAPREEATGSGPTRPLDVAATAHPAGVRRGRHRRPRRPRRPPGFRPGLTRLRELPARLLPAHETTGAAQAGVVLGVVVVGLVLSVWWFLRVGGGSEVVAPPVVTAGDTTSQAASPSPSASAGTGQAAGSTAGSDTGPTTGAPTDPGPSGGPVGGHDPRPLVAPGPGAETLVVDVVGRVRHPGVVVLPAGARVVDAVRAVGGLLDGVRRSSVNLARPLVDGEQVVVGGPGAPTAAPLGSTAPGATAPVNLNTADQAMLESLPGVGPVTAQAIVAWRDEHGGFSRVEELLEVSGIGDATLAELAPLVTV